MSKFYQALERAEQERTLRRQERSHETVEFDHHRSLQFFLRRGVQPTMEARQ
jgi:hypothetical protein